MSSTFTNLSAMSVPSYVVWQDAGELVWAAGSPPADLSPAGCGLPASLDELDPRVDWTGLAAHLRQVLPRWWAAMARAHGPEPELAFLLVQGWLLAVSRPPSEDDLYLARSAQSWAVLAALHLFWTDESQYSRWARVRWTEEGEGARGLAWEVETEGVDGGPLVYVGWGRGQNQITVQLTDQGRVEV